MYKRIKRELHQRERKEKRKCLKCGDKFKSSGAENRVCSGCKRKNNQIEEIQ